uniref:Uncharacterized protein n=1 Tax=Romanomermis culicivorax TaxID=13658 RepID=A0A915K7D6_ROMCU
MDGKCTNKIVSNVARKKINRLLVSEEETPDQLKKYASRPVPNNLIEYRGPECPFIVKTTDFKLYSTFITKHSSSSLDDAQYNNG